MDKISSSDIIQWTGGRALVKDFFHPPRSFHTVSIDSRKPLSHALFIALRGEQFDGHDFLAEAFAKGAEAALVSQSPQNSFPCILVKDTRQGLGEIAAGYRKRFSCPIVGIAGSDGKTTTKEMVSAILNLSFRTVATEKNLNNEIGLPLNILRLENSSEAGVFEIGINAPGELSRLSSILSPDIAILTGIGYSHIGIFQTRRILAESKCELFNGLSKKGYAAANADTPFSSLIKERSPVPVSFFGIHGKGDLQGIIEKWSPKGFVLNIPSWNECFPLTFWNAALAYSALAALWVGNHFEIKKSRMREVLASFTPLKGRGAILTNQDITLFDESYNANPASMKNALHYFSLHSAKRKIAVLGTMAELGRHSKQYHTRLGKFLATLSLDLLLTCGKETESLIPISGISGKHFTNAEELGEWLSKNLQKGDAILIKGSRVNQLETVITALFGSKENPYVL